MNALKFEWDERKANANLKKHGVSFDEARTVFFDVRFDNEAEAIKERGGYIIEVRNSRVPKLEGSHASEQGINPKYVDGIFHNEGTLQDLYKGADQMLVYLGLDLSR